ncbi:hypothetical protein FP568_13225 [Pandoraea pnomenusa]|uniref:hypothetical protein n=1 Tax=Pandoraea pnomenusa TaxID=93220 RepID=UPI00119837F7|nr:hypothetical protein [Pandoraea pnomenusa]QDX22122.1 hypothetical protein FP568_13225 [Pandoraea pnomenusa]
MAVTTTTSRVSYVGDGTTTVFAVPFYFLTNPDLNVYVGDTELTTGYTVTGAGNEAGGSVEITPAPAASAQVVIVRNPDPLQQTRLPPNDPFPAQAVEDMADKLTMLVQRNGDLIGRALVLADTDVDGSGAYRANQNRVQDIGDPVLSQDAVNLRTLQTALANFVATGGGDFVLALLANAIDPTLGVSLVGGAGRVVPSIAQIRSMTNSAKNPRIFATSRDGDFKGGGGPYVLDSSDTTSTDNGGTIIVAADGGRYKLPDQYVNSGTWGAKGDWNGTTGTDDTAALQAYINWCLSFTIPKAMAIMGMCRLTASLNIDIPVLPTLSEFRIFAGNSNSGFYVGTNVTMFDSTLPMTSDPVSGPVVFENLRCEAASSATGALFISGKFLRCKFLNCYYHRLNFCASTSYLQSFYWQNCTFRYWPGVLIGANHVFDCTFASCITEFGGGYVFFLPAGSYGLRLVDGVHEGSVGGLVSGGGFRGLKISGYYGEGNAFPFMGADYGPQNPDIEVSNCWIQSQASNAANASFYELVWGNTVNAISHNNAADNGRLHNLDSLPFTFGGSGTPILWSTGDRAAVALASKPLYLSNAAGTFTPTFNIGGGVINSATYRRNGYRVSIEFNVTCPTSSSGSPVQLQGLPYAALSTVFGGETLFTGITGGVFLIGGTGAGATQTSIGLCSNQQGTGINGLTASGKGVVGKLEYLI